MGRYAVYDKKTGQIIRCVRCAANQSSIQSENGQGILEIDEDIDSVDMLYKVKNNKLVSTGTILPTKKIPSDIQINQMPAMITNEQLQDILQRLANLEA